MIVTIYLTTLRISIKQSVILPTFKPYIRRYLQRLNKKKIILSQGEKETNITRPKIMSTGVDRLQRE